MDDDAPCLPPGFDRQAEFPIVDRWTFLNHAGVAPISARAAAAIGQFAREARDDAYLTGHWYRRLEDTRRLCARLINAAPEEIAFVKNTSEGLAFVANGLTWQPGRRIVSTRVEYPSNVYPWMDVAARCGVEHVMLPESDGRIDAAAVAASLNDRTALVALSHVEYASGFRHDLATIGAECRRRGILFCVDGIQSCGATSVDVRAMNIDFLSADGHKWLLGPEGAGFFFCRRELLGALHPEIGWMNVINATDFGHYDFTLRPDARRFECGSHNIPGVLALGASLALLLEVGIDTVSRRILALTRRLCRGLEEKGYRVISSRRPGEESGIVSFVSRRHGHEPLVKELEEKKIIIVVRENRLRASPHFYNTTEDIDHLLDALPRDA